jgi:hypothetical protein
MQWRTSWSKPTSYSVVRAVAFRESWHLGSKTRRRQHSSRVELIGAMGELTTRRGEGLAG